MKSLLDVCDGSSAQSVQLGCNSLLQACELHWIDVSALIQETEILVSTCRYGAFGSYCKLCVSVIVCCASVKLSVSVTALILSRRHKHLLVSLLCKLLWVEQASNNAVSYSCPYSLR